MFLDKEMVTGILILVDPLVPVVGLDGPGDWVRISDTSYHLCGWGYHLSLFLGGCIKRRYTGHEMA